MTVISTRITLQESTAHLPHHAFPKLDLAKGYSIPRRIISTAAKYHFTSIDSTLAVKREVGQEGPDCRYSVMVSIPGDRVPATYEGVMNYRTAGMIGQSIRSKTSAEHCYFFRLLHCHGTRTY